MNERLLPQFHVMKDGTPPNLWTMMRDAGYSEDEARIAVKGFCKDAGYSPEETEEMLRNWKKVPNPQKLK